MDEAKKLVKELKVLMAKHDAESTSRATEILEWFKGQSPEVQKILDDFLIEDIDYVGDCLKETQKSIIADQMKGDLKRVLPLSFIAEHYFKKSASWLSQRINGTPVRGRIYTLNEQQKETFNRAMSEVGQWIGSFRIA